MTWEDPESWVDEFSPALFRFAMKELGNRDLAEDLVQETFLGALRNYRTFAERSSFLTWLLAILRRRIVDHRRANRRQETFAESDETGPLLEELLDERGRWRKTLEKWPADDADSIEREEFGAVFARCVERLPALLAEVFRLRDEMELDAEEVCEIVGISRGNLAVRLHRARMSLRECLENNWFGR